MTVTHAGRPGSPSGLDVYSPDSPRNRTALSVTLYEDDILLFLLFNLFMFFVMFSTPEVGKVTFKSNGD